MILSDLDLGGGHPYLGPSPGLVTGSVVVTGSRTVPYGVAGMVATHSVLFWVKAWQGIGGQAASTIPAIRYYLRQLEELARNPYMQPVYIQWTKSADSGAVLNAADLEDGWFYITSVRADYTKVASLLVPVQMTVQEVVQAGAARRMGMGYVPLAPGLSTNYAGAAQLAVGYPVGSVGLPATSVTRTGGEGAIPLSIGPNSSLNPLPLGLSATVANWFVGAVKVYDTIDTTANPVPVSPSSTFVHANWVRVYDRSHRFEGDCVVTNGLLLLLIQNGQARVERIYLWNTALTSIGWQQAADLVYVDNGAGAGTLRGISLECVGPEATLVRTTCSTTSGNEADVLLRLERGTYFCRADLRPLTQSPSTNNVLELVLATAPKIAYNPTAATDYVTGAANLAVDTTYGYGAAFAASAAAPLVAGILYQNKPATAQPQINSATAIVGLGDISQAQGSVTSYGVYAVPIGVGGSWSTATLQAEAEGGTLNGTYAGAGSVADAAASAGNAYKMPGGAAVTGPPVLVFGTAWTPPVGTVVYGWFRVRTGTNGAGGTNEMVGGIVNSSVIASPLVGVSIKPNQASTTYKWFRTPVWTSDGTTALQFTFAPASSPITPSVDWYVDEAFYAIVSIPSDYRGPQDLWSQFMADRTAGLARL